MAKGKLRLWVKRFFFVLNVLFIGIFFLGALTRYLSPADWWVTAFAGLLLPYVVIILILFIFFWLIAKPILSLLSIITLLIGHQQIGVLYSFQNAQSFNAKKDSDHLRIISWNVGNLNGLSKGSGKQTIIKQQIATTIKDYNPDVICLQEFNHSTSGNVESNHIALFKKEYPYYFFSKDLNKKNGYQYGTIIFSKKPFIQTFKYSYANSQTESLVAVDVTHQQDTIRIFSTHLQSFRFNKYDYEGIEKIKQQADEDFIASKNIFKKMKLAYQRRAEQAITVKAALASSPYKSIICGDFNDVPNSFTYFTIKQEKQDAFLQKGFGIGNTFNSLAPFLRIDYILLDKEFLVHQFDIVDEGLSDHSMLVADVTPTTANR